MSCASLKYFSPFLLICLFMSCSEKDDASGPNEILEIVPLALGNTWVFELTTFDTLGNIESVDTRHLIVDRDTMINDQRWFRVKWQLYPSSGATPYIQWTGYYRNSTDGLYTNIVHPNMVYKFPAAPLDTIANSSTGITEVVSTQDTIVVPFGALSCYHYKSTLTEYGGIVTHSYASPGVGWVWEESASYALGGRWYLSTRTRLISFHIN